MTDGHEQRLHPREVAQRRGVLVDSLSGRSYRCTIVDISKGGAQLEVLAPDLAEGALALLDPDGGATYEVRIAWKGGERMGVAFLRSVDLP